MLASVVVPFKNSASSLSRLGESLVRQDFPKEDYELIFVNDSCTDGSDTIIENIAGSKKVRVRLVNNAGRGSFSARNTGIRDSEGKVIAFIDADMVADGNWLFALIAPILADERLGGVSGRTLPLSPSEVCIGPLFVDQSEATGQLAGHVKFGTGNIAYRKSVLMSVGLFDEQFDPKYRGDTDLGLRILEAGFRIQSEKTAVAYHPIQKFSFRALVKRGIMMQKDVLLYKKHGKLVVHELGGKLTRPLIACFSALGLISASFATLNLTSAILVGPLPAAAETAGAVCVWFIAYVAHGYKHAVSPPASASEVPMGSRILSAIAFPVFWLAVLAGRVYGSLKYRCLLF